MSQGIHTKKALKILWIIIGAGIGLALALVVVETENPELSLASLGGSAFYLFGLTTAPASQPRALLGGHLIAALVGVVSYQVFGDAPWVMAIAILGAIAVMLITKTVHPSALANPLIMMQAQANLWGIWTLIFSGVLVLMVIAMIWSRLGPSFGLQRHHYPLRWNQPSPEEEYRGP